ncbi:hemin receptor [Bacteroidia bacterium]|nr:hemin receptor [Bacteroidia bacterium]
MKKLNIILIISVLHINYALSQDAEDALRFSQYYSGGTARSMALSGAFGALGGDVSTLSANPAGVAIYRSSEFMFTPSLNFTNTNALFEGAKFKENYSYFNIDNIGYVHTWNVAKENGLKSITFGMAYNRLSDFNSDAYVYNANMQSSLLDDFTDILNSGADVNDSYEGLALDDDWGTSAIWYDKDDDRYYSDYDWLGRGQPMKRTIGRSGGIGEYAFSLGANFNDKIYWGATWGIHSLDYKEFYTHQETPEFQAGSSDMRLDWFAFHENYNISGWGMNFKTGVIYRPIHLLRVGVAVHTPTAYWLRTELATDMTAGYNTPTQYKEYSAESPIADNDRYRMNTPWRFQGSAAVIIGPLGLVSLEAEYVDYSAAKFRPNADWSDKNADISQIAKSTVNLKAGTEWRLGPVALRAGAAYYGNPHSSKFFDNNTELSKDATLSFSGGIGFKGQNFYADIAYVYTKFPDYYYDMYFNPAESQWVSPVLQSASSKVAVTVGFKF